MASVVRKSTAFKTVSSLVISGLALWWGTPAAQAEGSRNLYPATATGNRANIEWRAPTVQYANFVTRRTLLRVYANAGEVILTGSSAVGVNLGDILIYDPGLVTPDPTAGPNFDLLTPAIGQEVIPPVASFSCNDQRTALGNAALGQITTRAQELAGPDTIPGGNVPGGYAPCSYVAPTTGIYTVVITGPSGLNSTGDTAPSGSIPIVQTGAGQDSTVAAWDVTVRADATSTLDINGRLFSYYLALFTGANGRLVNSTVFAMTSDGYLYETGLNGIDPNGFVIYGNNSGFTVNDNGEPVALERDVVTTTDQLLDRPGEINFRPPAFPIFFSQPDPTVIAALRIPPIAVAPAIAPNSLTFTGTAGANNSFFNTGGTFTYQANLEHSFQLVISRDGVDFDPTNPQNRVLRGRRNAGTATVNWDGLDNSGTPFPVGTDYQVRLVLRTGEYHFPLLDVENAPNGSPILRLLNAPGNVCPPFAAPCTSAFYDDRGYILPESGTLVGPGVNQPLAANAPNPPNSSLELGFNTAASPNDRVFAAFGNTKALDLWTYYPSAPEQILLNIISSDTIDLSLRKTVDTPAASLGQNVTFTVTLANAGPATATGVQVTDRLPTGLTFVSATPSQGTYDNTTGLWDVGSVPANGTATLQITARLDTTAPVTNTAQVTGADQVDRDSTPGNDDPNEDDQASAAIGLPNFRIVKRITAVTREGQTQTFSSFVDDPTDTNDNAAGWSQLSPVGLLSVSPAEPLRSGNEVEYTVYFLSDGGKPAIDVNICDPIPVLTQLVGGSPRVQLGSSGELVPGGTVFSPLAPLPSGNSCPDQNNPNGAVIFDLGTVTNTPTTNVGFVRFRVRIN
ncbi:DUF11 domain-containing protein [Pantanalinema rosaneae CENA516]|uniref:DUF11 domain-containing protein n=1 Tax=Pantanalinema rosaneae TaxID=1620701 RepID=UPI003D6DF71F